MRVGERKECGPQLMICVQDLDKSSYVGVCVMTITDLAFEHIQDLDKNSLTLEVGEISYVRRRRKRALESRGVRWVETWFRLLPLYAYELLEITRT